MITIFVFGQRGAPESVRWAAERAARDMRRTGRTVTMMVDFTPESIASTLALRRDAHTLPNVFVVGLPHEAPDLQVQSILNAVRSVTNPKKES